MPPQIDPDKLARFNIKLPLSIVSTVIAASLGLTGLYLVNKEYRETFTFLVTALATSAGGASAFYAFRSIQQSTESQELDRKLLIESQIIDRTLLYIARWNDPQYYPARKTASELCQLKRNLPLNQQNSFLVDYLHQNPGIKQDILNLLNFLEEMSVCSKKGIIKEEFLRDYYRGIVIDFCDTFYVFIVQRRMEKKNEKIFKSLTDLREKWKND